ncbi:MAG: peptidyl-prolyl cis-trans isomerase SurA [Chthoniobacter sp.]|jgi:parvulin-like peptidyl-prolyl isomerase|nr:peptidyl-prolyl cis-trans isomerase SurA [Chthoniobacter sp.]
MARFVFVCLFALSFGLCGAAAEEQVLDGIAAVVNGEVITFSQVRELVGAREKALHDQYKGNELVEKIKEVRLAAVKDLVDRQLIIQEFKKNKFSIPDYVVDDHMQTIIREEFGGDRNAFVRTLEAQGYTMQRFKEVETEKIIVQAMRSKQVKTDVMIPPQRIAEYYHSHSEEFSTPEQVKLRMIVIKKPGATGKQMAEEIRQKVIDGATFEDLAQMYSEDSTKDAGGDWGWVDRKTLNESLTKVAFSLKPGTVSPVVESGGNFYLLYLDAKKNGSTKPLSAVHDEIEKKLLQEERQRLQQRWLDGLRQKAYIKMF